MRLLTDEIRHTLDAAFGNGRPAPGSVILYYNQKYGADTPNTRFEISILDREDLPVIDMTSPLWVLGIANEELFSEESYVRGLLAPAPFAFELHPHARTGRRRHGYWIADIA